MKWLIERNQMKNSKLNVLIIVKENLNFKMLLPICKLRGIQILSSWVFTQTILEEGTQKVNSQSLVKRMLVHLIKQINLILLKQTGSSSTQLQVGSTEGAWCLKMEMFYLNSMKKVKDKWWCIEVMLWVNSIKDHHCIS
jgi:hypothetical protein